VFRSTEVAFFACSWFAAVIIQAVGFCWRENYLRDKLQTAVLGKEMMHDIDIMPSTVNAYAHMGLRTH